MTSAGPVLAREDGEVVRALGIPYAHADRFAPPVPVVRYEEPVRASRPAPAAPQLPARLLDRLIGSTDGLATDERCQRLSITAPAAVGAGERLPVMVWVHGGGYVAGAGDLPQHDPVALVTEQRVVVVTVTYRLGMLGFLGDGRTVPANLGLLDLLAALRWVRDHIDAFGGDPGFVTLFGQSAGADAIAHLMVSDGADGLFRRAILQSAPLGITMRRRPAMAEAMLEAVGALPPGAGVEDVVARQPVAEVAARSFGILGTMQPFGVQPGHAPVPQTSDLDAAWGAAAPCVDVLIGSTLEEAAVMAALAPALRTAFGWPRVGPVLRRLITAPLTRGIYASPARSFAARHRAAGGRAHRYRLTWRPAGSPYGAAHLTDLPLLLGTREAWDGAALLGTADWADVERSGRELRGIWAEFARTGHVPARADSLVVTSSR